MEFKIVIPKTKNLRIKHFTAFNYVTTEIGESQDVFEQSIFISTLTGVSMSKLKMLSFEQIEKLFRYSLASFSGMKLGVDAPKEVTINGVDYEMVNPEKVGYGWHIDWRAKKFDIDPVWFACLFYIPKGSNYGETDENDNLLHPISERYEDFKEHFPLELFVNASAFFLLKSYKWMRTSMVKEKTKIAVTKFLNRLRGSKTKRQLTKSQENFLVEIGVKLPD